jgi:glycosyltransferase involved in cell wall biosynthesis
MNNEITARCKRTLKKAFFAPQYALRRSISRNRSARSMKNVDPRPIPIASQEIRLFMTVRNESLRLPFMLQYYFSRGVDRIFVVDNNSSDNTADIVRAEKNTHLFFTKELHATQASRIDLLLRRYGVGQWCLVVDADEALIYPYCETLTLRELCGFLDQESSNAMDSILLDMYPDVPLTEVNYESGSDPLLAAPCFDKGPYTTGCGGPLYIREENIIYEGPERMFGGMRYRLFGFKACLSKFPLIKFNKGMFLSQGTHFVQNARPSEIRGALLHFKYLHDFAANVKREVERQQHWHDAIEYKKYLSRLNSSPDFDFHSSLSTRFTDSRQLVALSLMKSSERLNASAAISQGVSSKM